MSSGQAKFVSPVRWAPSTEKEGDQPLPSYPAEIRTFLAYLATECGLAKNSLFAYRRDMESLATYFSARSVELSEAAPEDFQSFLRDQTRLGKSTRTLARRLATIKHFLKFQNRPDLQQILSQLDRPKPESSLPHVLSIAQVQCLISAPDPKDRLFFRDVAILELLYAAGLRASELCDLKIADVNLQLAVIRVFGKGSKERVVPLGRAAIEAIENYLRECRPKLDETRRSPPRRRRDSRIPESNSPQTANSITSNAESLLFLSRAGKPFDRISLWMLVEKYGRKSGLLNQVHPHILRHCFASHLLSGGADLRIVQELLGHADVATTQIYTHVDQKRLKATHLKYHPRA
ncbi:MAG TPA: tyrosine recombinase [Tepidisphaeraceae bacterium]|jgi:integrase/recombinase XerD